MKNMNNNIWIKKIKNNFNYAAGNYSEYCLIQKHFSKQIINILDGLNISDGDWFDLGAGTGLLADEIEQYFFNSKVSRVDFCNNMLLLNKQGSNKILWDLNKGLHPSIQNPSLLVSNFCIHWLNEPKKTLEEWFQKLKNGGKLIISYPTNNCFPEWKTTCKNYGIEYSGLVFPEEKNMIENFLSNEIIFSRSVLYKENFPNIYKLFRSIINIGAQSSQSKKNSVGEFKKLARYWPTDKNKRVTLTWEINILALQKI
tara:strand:+ start:73 stop:840 length:768 start_codon:yes stop_codon:yes gene_type:complete